MAGARGSDERAKRRRQQELCEGGLPGTALGTLQSSVHQWLLTLTRRHDADVEACNVWDEDEDDDEVRAAEMLKRATPGILSEAYGRGYEFMLTLHVTVSQQLNILSGLCGCLSYMMQHGAAPILALIPHAEHKSTAPSACPLWQSTSQQAGSHCHAVLCSRGHFPHPCTQTHANQAPSLP